MSKESFLIRKENIVMTGMTDTTLGRTQFIIFHSGDAGFLYVNTRFMLRDKDYLCSFDHTKKLCNDSTALRRMRVEDIERIVFEASQGR